MQEMIVFVIFLIAAGIVWKHLAPRMLRILINHTLENLAMRLGWKRLAEKLAYKTTTLSNDGSCSGCNNCNRASEKSDCEIRIPIKEIKRH